MSVLTPSFIRFHSAACLFVVLLTEKKSPDLQLGHMWAENRPMIIHPRMFWKERKTTHWAILRKDFTLCLKANDHNESVNLIPMQYESSVIS